jgi:hypothetical protein
MKQVEVERSALRVWMLALLGIPFVLLGLDVLTQHRFIAGFGALVYGSEQVPTFEPRDNIFALIAVVAGLMLVGWGLRDLIMPRKLIVADEDGVRLVLEGPLRRARMVPWFRIGDIHAETVDDDGQLLPALFMQFDDPGLLPQDPWSARWVGSHTLMIEASAWSRSVEAVAADLQALQESSKTEPEAMPWE